VLELGQGLARVAAACTSNLEKLRQQLSGLPGVQGFAEELAAARSNREIGTARWFENHHIRVFEITLDPGERCPFHCHEQTYFWTVVEAGRGLQRFEDGTYVVRDYKVGDTSYLEHTPDNTLIHDLENIGSTRLRFVTVELHH
jgi:beta-alanine degradation protein BauB